MTWLFVFIHCLQCGISCMHWDPSGHFLASCATESLLKVWMHKEESWTCHQTLSHSQPVVALEWCPQLGRTHSQTSLLATGCTDGAVSVWILPQPGTTMTQPWRTAREVLVITIPCTVSVTMTAILHSQPGCLSTVLLSLSASR